MEVSGLVRSLLEKRGITAAEDIETFLEPSYERGTHDPFMLCDMDRAVARLLLALERGERIAVYADYDCDGIPGAAVLHDFFKKVGHEHFEVYLPHRDREGYGFHKHAVGELCARGVSLIITVDVGTNARETVSHARSLGADVIVTDHHELIGELPEALAVLNPKRAGYPFDGLCGAAVAWKLVQATLREGAKRGMRGFTDLPVGWEKWLLDLVAIATIADMVPLTAENRVLAHWGLKVLRKSPRLGIRALVAKLRLRQDELTEDDIGFSIAPRINAASRMDEPRLALLLLTTNDAKEAHECATKLEKLNASRKGVVAGIIKDARKHLRARYTDEDHVVVIGNPEWKPALLGLAANSLMSGRTGAVCVWGRDASGTIRGSCRSDESVSVVALFEAAGECFIEFGGHARSGGFSVSPEQVHTLPESLKSALSTLEQPADRRMPDPEATLSLPDISRTLFAEVSRLAPFGAGNPKPLFCVRKLIVTEVRRFGKESQHLELALECRESGARSRAYDFFRSPEHLTYAPERGAETSLLATIERDTYRGGLALRIVDTLAP